MLPQELYDAVIAGEYDIIRAALECGEVDFLSWTDSVSSCSLF